MESVFQLGHSFAPCFFYSFNLLGKWFSVKEMEMKKKTY